MERWSGILKVPLHPNSRVHYRVGASICLSSSSKTLYVPSANAVFFNGDRVKGTRNPVIERLSDLQRIAEILVSKFGSSINAWVIEASTFNGPFAIYKDFIPSVNQLGEPKFYNPIGSPAATSIASLLSNCLAEVKNAAPWRHKELYQAEVSAPSSCQPKTLLLGFSKGGTILNQLVTELAFLEVKSTSTLSKVIEEPMSKVYATTPEENQIIPTSMENFLNSIAEVHYVDVGLNSAGAYLTNPDIINRLSKRIEQGASGIRFLLHGTPRQWCDSRRTSIRKEKDVLLQLLRSEALRSEGKLCVCERFYFADMPPNLQMHFEIIESLEVS